MSTTNIIVNGSTGRLGARIVALAASSDARVLAEVSRSHPMIGAAPRADVVVDASSDAGAAAAVAMADQAGAALLVCTTALSDTTLSLVRSLADRRAVMVAANTSTGVAAVHRALAELARRLGPAYEARLVETHHTAKRDAPSGTALALARTLRAAGTAIDDRAIVSKREGDVVGEHVVEFVGPSEVVTVAHRALSRDVFALGALRLARWLSAQPPGMYAPADAIG